jgi:hypothetical protein
MTMSSRAENGGQEQTKPSPMWWQSIVTIIPIALALGYIVAYLYELGYCSTFGIPSEFISPDTTHVLIAVSKVFLSAVTLFWVAYVFITMASEPRSRGPIQRRLILLMVIGFIYIAFAIDYPSARTEWYLIIPIFIIFILLFFVSPVITHRNIKGYRNKLIAQDQVNAATNPLNYIERYVGRSLLIILLLLIPWIVLPYFNAQTDATEQEDFLVPSTYPHSVVLRIYGDNLICAELDPQDTELTGRFFMISMDDEPKPYLSLQEIGHLAPRNRE